MKEESTENKEFKYIEYQQVIDSYKSHLNISIQVITALFISIVTVLGFAFDQQEFWILILAVIFVIAIIVFAITSEKATRYILIRAFDLAKLFKLYPILEELLKHQLLWIN